MQLLGAGNATFAEAVERSVLVRVLAITKRCGARGGDAEITGQSLLRDIVTFGIDLQQSRGDGVIVSGGM